MADVCVIPLKLPSLNDYIAACRQNAYKGAKMKRETEREIGFFVRRLRKYECPVTIRFLWIEKTAKRDLDNVAFAKKFILDAMVKNGKLPDDGQKWVKGFEDRFAHGDENKVILEVMECTTK